jgi:hypothetical protein
MPFYKFEKNELFYNRIKTYPSLNFNIYDGVVIYNNNTQYVGDLSSTNILNVPAGNISLYELNVDRPSGNLIYPFITKEGSRTSFKTVSTTNYNNDFAYGDTITGSYPLSANLSFDRFGTNITGSSCRYFRDALKNSLNRNSVYSPAYLFSSSLGNKGTQELKIISVPSIFYGSSIKKGTCSLKFYVSGTLIGELTDDIRNGELRQSLSSSGADSGSVAGVVMYDEGFIILTGSWDLDSSHTEDYGLAGNTNPRWIDFAYTGSVGTPYSSYDLSFSGTNYVPTMTMFAHASKSQLNFSNNPTYLKFGQSGTINSPITSSTQYSENSSVSIKNIVKTNFIDPTGSFSKTTYISKVGIYDEYKNLIAIANLPTPIRKREIDDFTFKLKLDF